MPASLSAAQMGAMCSVRVQSIRAITSKTYEFLRVMEREGISGLPDVFTGVRSVEINFHGFGDCSGAWVEEVGK
jgi:hypothetical protein